MQYKLLWPHWIISHLITVSSTYMCMKKQCNYWNFTYQVEKIPPGLHFSVTFRCSVSWRRFPRQGSVQEKQPVPSGRWWWLLQISIETGCDSALSMQLMPTALFQKKDRKKVKSCWIIWFVLVQWDDRGFRERHLKVYRLRHI